MKIQVKKGYLAAEKSDAVLAGVFEGAKKLTGAAAALDWATGNLISGIVKTGDFSGKLHKTAALYPKKLNLKRIILVGLGKEKDLTPDKLRGAAAAGARAARDLGVSGMLLPLDFAHAGFSTRNTAQALVEGVLLGLYHFKEFKTGTNDNGGRAVKACTLLAGTADELPEAKAGAEQAGSIAESVCLARDLVSRPGNIATPEHLAQVAKSIAARYNSLTCTVLDPQQIEKLKMGAFLSVARGSDEPSRFIVLEHKPRPAKAAPPVVLIGKAVTFDTGGISIKPSQGMEEMKTDMAGGAAVLGALQAAAALKLPVHVVGLIPATENMPSGHALKPGDIIKSMAGKTIEIISTDAEGRLLLADALTYAQRYKPAAVIDIATLTGACVIALGHAASGLLGTDDRLLKKIRTASEATGEKIWQLPLFEEYAEQLKSDAADLKNAGGRPAGTITAACFLREFAGAAPWAHIDIAGTAWTQKPLACSPKGATGVGVRLLVELLSQW